MTDQKLTPKKSAGEWRPSFLAALRNSANVRAACQAAGVTRQVAYQHREKSPDFRSEWDDAMQDACDVLEAEAWQRARSQSDVLLIFLLKAHRPERYRETTRTLNITMTADEIAKMNDADLDKLIAQLSRA